MKRLLRYTLSLFGFWLLVFALNRLFFLLYQWPTGKRLSDSADLYRAFYKGYRLDFSTSAILLLPPLLLGILYYVLRSENLRRFKGQLVFFLIVLYTAVAVGDAGLYREWNAKINMQALDHFRNPSEVMRTLSVKFVLLYLLLLGTFSFIAYQVYRRWIHPQLYYDVTEHSRKRVLPALGFFILSGGLAVIVIRGGITNIPINQSIAYFSPDILPNDVAVNPLYSLIQDLDIKGKLPEPSVYTIASPDAAKDMIAPDFLVPDAPPPSILSTNRPNIVILFLESWSADNIGSLGGIKDCTPHFDSLTKDGLLFTRAYANAYVSDQGIPAVLSGFPSASRLAITNQPAKVHHLPCLSEELAPLGYSSSFLFGGELVYGNLRGYLLEKKFSEMIEVYDLPQYPKGSLGIHDEYTLPELLQRLNKKKEPFLYGYFSQSTHMPYDFTPSDDWKAPEGDPEKLYTEAVHYADIHLGRFFSEARKQPWYERTLFVVVADHSHNTWKHWDAAHAAHHHIPLLLLGGALRNDLRGTRIDRIVSQLDVPAAILRQMGLRTERFPWSRDLFHPQSPCSAYYVYYGGVGYIDSAGMAGTYQASRDFLITDVTDSIQASRRAAKARAFQQRVYESVLEMK